MTNAATSDPSAPSLPDLREIVRTIVQNLTAATNALVGCGLEHHANTIQGVRDKIEMPQMPAGRAGTGSDHFVVRATFRVPRAALFEVLAEVASSDGSWYRITEAIQPQPHDAKGGEDRASAQCPLAAGGALLISTVHFESKVYRLDFFTISLGLEVMAVRYARQFASLLNEEESPQTADVFLQCCLFGAVIYGPSSGLTNR